MRRIAFVALVPLVATTLAVQNSAAQVARGTPGEQQVGVKILPPSPQTNEPLRYALSEPAYVAAFIVYPGAGVRMIYPLGNTEEIQYAGYHSDALYGLSFDNDLYNVALAGGPEYGPRYLYVIASRYPLDVAQYVHRPMELERAVGVNAARSFDTNWQFDALVNHVVSLGDDLSWDADVYMLWAQPVYPSASAYAYGYGYGYDNGYGYDALGYDNLNVYYHNIRCYDGRIITVPYNYPFVGCPGDARLVPNPNPPRLPATLVRASSKAPPPPTVLPTIVGVRRAPNNPEGQGHIAESVAPRITAAGGYDNTAAEAQSRMGQPAAPTVVIIPEYVQPISPRGWDQAHDRNRWRDHSDARRRDMGSPRAPAGPTLAPAPRLAPAPQLAPPPLIRPPEIPHYTAPPAQASRPEMHSAPPPPAPPRAQTSAPAHVH